MSFGEGDLHAKCEMYRKQLGGTQAALNRSRQRCEELEAEVASLRERNRELRDELTDDGYFVPHLGNRIELLEKLVRYMRLELVYAHPMVDEDGDTWLDEDGEDVIGKVDAVMRECGMEVG